MTKRDKEWIAIEETIASYSEERRKRLSAFVEKHFALQECTELQKRSLPGDLIRHPLNTLWAIPYLAVKTIVESADKLGMKGPSKHFERLPSGFKTDFQHEIEWLIAVDLFQQPYSFRKRRTETDDLRERLEAHPALKEMKANGELERILPSKRDLKKELDKYSAARTLISDTVASVTTLLMGRMFFGESSLGASGLSEKFASGWAKERASSNFFLGKSAGQAFYGIFPAKATTSDLVFATALVLGVLFLVSFVSGVLSEPARKKLGLQTSKLGTMIDDFESTLVVGCRKRHRQLRASEDSKDPRSA